MKIVVLTGSPHKQGTSGLLAEKFIEGAKKAGHEIFRFDAAFSNVHPCIGCDKYRKRPGYRVYAGCLRPLLFVYGNLRRIEV